MYRFFVAVALVLPLSVLAADIEVSGRVSARGENTSVDVVFSNHDKEIIQQYYSTSRRERSSRKDYKREGRRDRNLPRGLAKRRGNMPSGLSKRDGNLPPGLAKRDRLPEDVEYEPLPTQLEKKLPPLPSSDYVRVKVGGDFVIFNQKTRVVFDIAHALSN